MRDERAPRERVLDGRVVGEMGVQPTMLHPRVGKSAPRPWWAGKGLLAWDAERLLEQEDR